MPGGIQVQLYEPKYAKAASEPKRPVLHVEQ